MQDKQPASSSVTRCWLAAHMPALRHAAVPPEVLMTMCKVIWETVGTDACSMFIMAFGCEAHLGICAGAVRAAGQPDVVLTREAGKNGEMARRLRDRAVQVLEMPLVETGEGPDRC